MTLEEMGEKAARLMIKRFHCSQAVLAVGQEKLGRPDDEVIRAMGAFGGGLGGNGEVCGAVAGALAVVGLKFSRGREEEKEDPKMWDYAHELLKRFREEIVKKHGNITCAGDRRGGLEGPGSGESILRRGKGPGMQAYRRRYS